MKNFKKMMAFGILMGGLTASTSFAGTGIIISDAAAPKTCAQNDSTGIIISDATGIIVSDVTGIIVSDAAGVIMSDVAGVIMSDVVKSDECPVSDGIIISD